MKGQVVSRLTIEGGQSRIAMSNVVTAKNIRYFTNQESHCNQLVIPIILIASCNTVTIVTKPNIFSLYNRYESGGGGGREGMTNTGLYHI